MKPTQDLHEAGSDYDADIRRWSEGDDSTEGALPTRADRPAPRG